MRRLYRCLLWMHPPSFRQRFASEMLWIFDESGQQSAGLYSDCLLSLLRQWGLRSGLWKVIPAIIGGCLQVSAGAVLGLVAWRVRSGQSVPTHTLSDPEMRSLIELIMVLSVAIVFMVLALSMWLKSFIARRSVRL